MDSRYNNNDQEGSDGKMSDLKNVYNVFFSSIGKIAGRKVLYTCFVHGSNQLKQTNDNEVEHGWGSKYRYDIGESRSQQSLRDLQTLVTISCDVKLIAGW